MKAKDRRILRRFCFPSYNNTEIDILIIETVVELNMAEDHKKSESDSESEIEGTLEDTKRVVANNAKWCLKEFDALKARLLALEKALTHAQHTNTDDGSRHQNDGGWFD